MNDSKTTGRDKGLRAKLWSALKDAVIEDSPVPRAHVARSATTAQGASRDPASSATRGPADASTASAAPSPMAKQLLELVLGKATAYTALTDKLAPLAAVLPDERTRYQAAYALIQSSRSVEQLVQAIDLQHQQALDAEVARFDEQMKEQERREVASRVEHVASAEAQIRQSAAQIERVREDMQARIRQIEDGVQRECERLARLNTELDTKRQEIARVRSQFDTAVQWVRDALLQERSKLLAHLR